MIYEAIDVLGASVIKRINEDKTETFIPLNPANRDYAEYLRYTEWVEAGNNPDEFWKQEN